MTITLGPASTGRKHHGSRYSLPWLAFLAARWASRWSGRVVVWSGRQAVRRSAGHVSRARHTWREWSEVRAEHGFRSPVVWDLSTGTAHKAHEVDLKAPAGGDPEVRARQAEDALRFRERVEQARADHMMSKRVRPPWWERWLAARGLREVDRRPYDESLRARFAVMARRRERLAREAAAFGRTPHPAGWESAGRYVGGTERWGLPDLDDLSPFDPLPRRSSRQTRTRGDGSMATPIRQWADLADPGIDPFEFPEELPTHFAEVRNLLAEEAALIEAAADSGARGSAAFADYVEYLSRANVDGSVLSPISDAGEMIAAAVAFMRQAAEAMANAATLAEQAQQAAEAKYGDWEVPRFDQAG